MVQTCKNKEMIWNDLIMRFCEIICRRQLTVYIGYSHLFSTVHTFIAYTHCASVLSSHITPSFNIVYSTEVYSQYARTTSDTLGGGQRSNGNGSDSTCKGGILFHRSRDGIIGRLLPPPGCLLCCLKKINHTIVSANNGGIKGLLSYRESENAQR